MTVYRQATEPQVRSGLRGPSLALPLRATIDYRAKVNLIVKVLDFVKSGGAGGTRTLCLFNAIEALSRLSYSPTYLYNIAKGPKERNGVCPKVAWRQGTWITSHPIYGLRTSGTTTEPSCCW